MARWLALVKLPDAPHRQAAELVAIDRFGADLIRVSSVVDFEEAEREANALRKRRTKDECE